MSTEQRQLGGTGQAAGLYWTVQVTVYSVQVTVYSLMYSVQVTVYSVLYSVKIAVHHKGPVRQLEH